MQRYHISPLKYDDGTELEEKDYFNLGTVLLKYYYGKQLLQDTRVPRIPDGLAKKAADHMKRSLLGVDFEGIMDILMEQQGGIVL